MKPVSSLLVGVAATAFLLGTGAPPAMATTAASPSDFNGDDYDLMSCGTR